MIGIFGCIEKDNKDPESSRISLNRMVSSISGKTATRVVAASKLGGLGICYHEKGSSHGWAFDEDRKLSLVMLGDVFNAHSINPKKFKRGGVAGVLLDLYVNNNMDLLRNFNGLFCAAILDDANHSLHLITDRFASFPIHIYESRKKFIFSTMIYTLLSEGSVPRKPCIDGITQLFTLQRTLGPWSNIANVKPVSSSSIFSLRNNKQETKKYWKLDWGSKKLPDKEIANQLTESLKKAVGRQTSFEVSSPGLLLSGGLDSRIILGSAGQGSLSSWTTASYAENPELAIAKQVSKYCKSEFHPLLINPSETLNWHEQTVIENNGLYPSSTSYSSFMHEPASKCDVLLTGHGLDYTLRGYYLPAVFLKIANSSTRLPAIRNFKEDIDGKLILENLRQGPPLRVLNKIIKKERREEWWNNLVKNFSQTLAPWLQSGEPMNAWDAFIVNQVSQHYAFTGMMAVRAKCNLRIPAFDNDIFEIYLKMSPQQRASGRAALMSMEIILTI